MAPPTRSRSASRSGGPRRPDDRNIDRVSSMPQDLSARSTGLGKRRLTRSTRSAEWSPAGWRSRHRLDLPIPGMGLRSEAACIEPFEIGDIATSTHGRDDPFSNFPDQVPIWLSMGVSTDDHRPSSGPKHCRDASVRTVSSGYIFGGCGYRFPTGRAALSSFGPRYGWRPGRDMADPVLTGLAARSAGPGRGSGTDRSARPAIRSRCRPGPRPTRGRGWDRT